MMPSKRPPTDPGHAGLLPALFQGWSHASPCIARTAIRLSSWLKTARGGGRPRDPATETAPPHPGEDMPAQRAEPEVMIRRAQESDGRRCAEIFLASRRATFHGQAPQAFEFEDYDRSVAEEDVWVAEVDGQVVGFCSVYHPENTIHHLFVDPSWQHRGIGTRLLAQVAEQMNRPAKLICLESNVAARSFYQRNGWTEAAREAKPDQEPYIVFQKP